MGCIFKRCFIIHTLGLNMNPSKTLVKRQLDENKNAPSERICPIVYIFFKLENKPLEIKIFVKRRERLQYIIFRQNSLKKNRKQGIARNRPHFVWGHSIRVSTPPHVPTLPYISFWGPPPTTPLRRVVLFFCLAAFKTFFIHSYHQPTTVRRYNKNSTIY